MQVVIESLKRGIQYYTNEVAGNQKRLEVCKKNAVEIEQQIEEDKSKLKDYEDAIAKLQS